MSYRIKGIVEKKSYVDFLIEENGFPDIIRMDIKTGSRECLTDAIGIHKTDKLYDRYLAELLIDRSKMPQIRDMDDFIQWCGARVKITKKVVRPDYCEPVQLIDPHKTASIADTLQNGKRIRGVILSKDGKIVDGHHRWSAHDKLGRNIEAYIMDVDFPTAYKMAIEYYASHKN